MQEQQLLERITLNPNVMLGKPVIRGTRLTVEYILNLLAHGTNEAEILDEYPGLTHKDIQACLLFAKKSLENTCCVSVLGYVVEQELRDHAAIEAVFEPNVV